MNRNNTFDLASHTPNLTSKIAQKKRLFKKELSLIFIVGLIGCAGTLFVFNKSWFPEKFDVVTNFASITISNSSKTTDGMAIIERPFLEVKGESLINSEITFQIKNFNPNATYKIEFGDGAFQICEKDIIFHTYDKHGSYLIEMKMQFRNSETVVYNKTISIADRKSPFLSSL